MLHLKKIVLVAGIISVSSFVWWIVSPMLSDQVVDEPILQNEMASVQNTTEKMTIPPETAPETEAVTTTQAVTAAETVTESQAVTAAETVTTTQAVTAAEAVTTTQAIAATEAVTTTQATTATEAVTEAPEETKLYTGIFRDGVKRYKTSGLVKTLIVDDKVFLRLEDFETTNGPDLFVYLVIPGTETKAGINLGALKGNKGNQNYEVPLNVDLAKYHKVVIWCKAFDSDFGYADLE